MIEKSTGLTNLFSCQSKGLSLMSKCVKIFLIFGLCLCVFTSPAKSTASLKTTSCKDLFSSGVTSLTTKQISIEVFNYKLLIFELNELKRLQSLSDGANSQSITGIEAELQTRKIRLIELGISETDLSFSKLDLEKIRSSSDGSPIKTGNSNKVVAQTRKIDKAMHVWSKGPEIESSILSEIHFSPDGKTLLSVEGGSSSAALIRKSKTLALHKTLSTSASSADFSPDGTRAIVVEQRDNRVVLYNTKTGAEIPSPIQNLDIVTAQYGPGEETVFLSSKGSNGGAAGIQWNLRNKTPEVFYGELGNIYLSTSVSLDRSILVTLNSWSSIEIWDVANATVLPNGVRQASKIDERAAETSSFLLALSPDAKSFARSSNDDNTIEVRQITSSGFGEVVDRKFVGMKFKSIAYSPDSRFLALGTYNGRVLIYSFDEKKIQSVIQASGSFIDTIAFSYDNNSLVIHSGEGKLAIWNYERLID